MKKKWLAVAAAGLMALGLTGCHSHEFGEWKVKTPATCLEEGLQERSCECGETETEAIPAAGHSFGEWETVTPVTCTEDGEEKRTCSECGETETRVVEATGHSFTPATLFAPKTCSLCGETEGEALGHVIGIGEEQTGEKYKFTISDIYFATKASEKQGFVTHNSAEGYYLIIKMSFTNLANETLEQWSSDRVGEMLLQYDGQYDYEGEFRVLTDDIVPLDTRNAYIMYSVPETMGKEDGKSVNASFKIDGDTYVVQVREGALAAAEGQASGETEGTAAAGETDESEAAAENETELTAQTAVGDTRTDGESFRFTLDQVYYATKVSEKRGSTTYSTQDGNYLVLKMSYTNLANEVVKQWSSDRVTDMQLVFDGQYNYEGEFRVLIDDIVPLDTKNAYILYSIPEMVETSEGPLEASFKINGHAFKVDCRANQTA